MSARSGGGWTRYGQVITLSVSEGTISVLVAPYLRFQGYDFSAIGFLVAVAGITALLSRLPSGMFYRPGRARALMAGSLVAMGLTCTLYPATAGPLSFGLVRALYGLVLGVATTTNLAMYMDALPSGRSKAQAMGIYGGCLAAGYSLGSFIGGATADLLGYTLAYGLAGLWALAALVLLFLERRQAAATDPPGRHGRAARAMGQRDAPLPRGRGSDSGAVPQLSAAGARLLESRLASALRPLRAFSEPRVVVLALIAFMLNVLHQVGITFFPLYGLSIGMSLSEVGAIKGLHALTNAIARPLAGPPISRFGHRRVSYVGLTLLAGALALIPSFRVFLVFAGLFVVIGLLRAVVLVANTVGIADLDETRMSRGLASGLYNGAKDLGNLVGPIVCGPISELVGLPTMFVLVPPLATLSFFVLVGLQRRRAEPLRQPRTGPSGAA